MKLEDFRYKIQNSFFSFEDLLKFYPDEKINTLKTQIYRWIKKGKIFRLKRGFYLIKKEGLNLYFVANILYQPSYISLESALFYYGIIPDIPFVTTSITTITKKEIKTIVGRFIYRKISVNLYFGFEKIKIGDEFVQMAYKEKAILDYLYIYKFKRIDDLRIDWQKFDKSKLNEFSKNYPVWVQKLVCEAV
ncbi:MAG: hypothetical protein QHH09_01975 [Microgenomates group bacterium]|nr:hypothetical protein [Microgenomates group bacterium]